MWRWGGCDDDGCGGGRAWSLSYFQWYNQLPELEVGWMDGFGIFAGRMDGSKQGGRTSYPRPTPVIPRVHFDLNLSEKPKNRTIFGTNT